MKRKQLKPQLIDYMESQDGWVHSGDLERLALYVGYKASTAGRMLRKMRENRELEQKLVNRSVVYRIKTELQPTLI